MASVQRIVPAKSPPSDLKSSLATIRPLTKVTATVKDAETNIRPPKLNPLVDTKASAKVMAKSQTLARSTQTHRTPHPMETQIEAESHSQAALGSTVQESPASKVEDQPSLLSLLPKLQMLLGPEQYSIVEAAANLKLSSSSIPKTVAISPAAISSDVEVNALNLPGSSTSKHIAASPALAPFDILIEQKPKLLEEPVSAPTSTDLDHIDVTEIDTLAQDILDKRLQFYVKQMLPKKFRCMINECSKAFESFETWKKHVGKRHSQWLEDLESEVNTHTQNMVKAGLEQDDKPTKAESTVAPSVSINGKAKSSHLLNESTDETVIHETKEDETSQLRFIQSLGLASSPKKENTPLQTTIIKTSANLSSTNITSSSRYSRRSLGDSLARQREAIIGEHVVKTRFLPAASMLERFENLTIAVAAPALLTKTSNAIPKATIKPFGPPKPSVKTDKSALAPRSSFSQPTTFKDPGAAAHELNRGANSNIEPAKPSARPPKFAFTKPPAQLGSSAASHRTDSARGAGLSLPAFLQGEIPSADPGEAARLQYGAIVKEREDPLEVARKRGL